MYIDRKNYRLNNKLIYLFSKFISEFNRKKHMSPAAVD